MTENTAERHPTLTPVTSPPLTIPTIELNIFLKKMGVEGTGGQVKLFIRSGKLLVNGVVDVRNRRKLVVGDVVEYDGKKHIVQESHVRLPKTI